MTVHYTVNDADSYWNGYTETKQLPVTVPAKAPDGSDITYNGTNLISLEGYKNVSFTVDNSTYSSCFTRYGNGITVSHPDSGSSHTVTVSVNITAYVDDVGGYYDGKVVYKTVYVQLHVAAPTMPTAELD